MDNLKRKKVMTAERVLVVVFLHRPLCVFINLLFFFLFFLAPVILQSGTPLPDRRTLELILDKLQKYVFSFSISQCFVGFGV